MMKPLRPSPSPVSPALASKGKAAIGIAWLLRTDFSGVSGQPVTLNNLDVLDTVAEGIIDGSVTVYGNDFDILSNCFGQNNNQQNSTSACLRVTSGITFRRGLSTFATVNDFVTSTSFIVGGWLTADQSDWATNRIVGYYDLSALKVGPVSSGISGFYDQVSNGYSFAVVGGGYNASGDPWDGSSSGDYTYGFLLFIHDGANWKLSFPSIAANATTVYPLITTYSSTANRSPKISSWSIPDHDLSAVLAPFWMDTWQYSNGDLSSPHTPEVGSAATANNLEVIDNLLTTKWTSGTSYGGLVVSVPSGSDYVAEGRIAPRDANTWGAGYNLGSGFYAQCERISTVTKIVIRESSTIRASTDVSWTVGNFYRLACRLEDGVITLVFGGGDVATYNTAGTLSSATTVSFSSNAIADASPVSYGNAVYWKECCVRYLGNNGEYNTILDNPTAQPRLP